MITFLFLILATTTSQLMKMTAKRDQKRNRNEQIFPDKEFPLHADWFTGRIHLAVGGNNQRSEKSEFVIVFEIADGIVSNPTFDPEYEIPSEWNVIHKLGP
jgi:hypothetical protein